MKKYDFFLFDLDGTLIETEELILECFRYSLKRVYAVSPAEKTLSEKIGLPLAEQMRRICEENELEPIPFSDFQKIHMDYQMKIWDKYVKPFPGVGVVLQALVEKGKTLAIVTSRKLPTTKLYLEHSELKKYFSALITPESTEKHKPEAEPALKAMAEIGALAQKTLFVGDSLYDMECAEKAGLDKYLVEWGSTSKKKITTPSEYREKNLNKILHLI